MPIFRVHRLSLFGNLHYIIRKQTSKKDNRRLGKRMNDLIATVRQMMGQTELPQEIFIDAIETALMQAARRRYGTTDGIRIMIDGESGLIRCFVPKKVVNIMRSYAKEIPIEEALEVKPGAEIGETIEVEVDLKDFGRIEASTARQILTQKIKDAERQQVYRNLVKR